MPLACCQHLITIVWSIAAIPANSGTRLWAILPSFGRFLRINAQFWIADQLVGGWVRPEAGLSAWLLSEVWSVGPIVLVACVDRRHLVDRIRIRPFSGNCLLTAVRIVGRATGAAPLGFRV